jgi:hypothetical protein
MSTVFGWPLVPMPAIPAAPALIEWTAMDTVAVSQSPFTGQQQTQVWPGSWLEASISMPPMKHATVQAWLAWLLQVQGMAGVFQLGDPLAALPTGTGAGSPVVSGAGQTGSALNTSGWSGANSLLPGDWIQIGYRLYRNLGIVGAGPQTLSIWPPLRESPPDATPIAVTNTVGLFRLKSNARKWSQNPNRLYGMQFDIREAI